MPITLAESEMWNVTKEMKHIKPILLNEIGDFCESVCSKYFPDAGNKNAFM